MRKYDILPISVKRAIEDMITSNVVHRTFQIKWGGGKGTVFAIERNSKQYLVTARHVVEGISANDEIEIYHEQQWKSLAIRVVGVGEDETDVAVLACSVPFVFPFPLPLDASIDGLAHGQLVYFLGFPFGWRGGFERLNMNFPMPFVKAGILSATDEANSLIYIDGYGNAGFSGGPVVFRPSERPSSDFQVAGIVSHYPLPSLEPLVDEQSCPIVDEDNRPIAYFLENPGFVVASEIKLATNLIDANPIGLELPNQYQSL